MESGNLISKVKVEKNILRSAAKYEIIKAYYFLIKIFNNLNKGKTLNIVKYNKKIKERINININDYKEYSEKCSSIEIEIKPVNRKYGKFINNENKKIYYHIYFNNNDEEEIKRNYISKDEEIKIIKIKIDYQVKSFEYLFYGCDCIESIYFTKFYRNNIDNMGCMFSECLSLKELNLSNFNTNNAKEMSYMFYGYKSLTKLNLNNLKTIGEKYMTKMFNGCKSLINLDFPNFKGNIKTDKYKIFDGCDLLKKSNYFMDKDKQKNSCIYF